MCGKAYDPRFLCMAHARIAVMGGEQAAKTLLQIQVSALKSKGEIIDPAVEKKLLDEIKGRYENRHRLIMRQPVYGRRDHRSGRYPKWFDCRRAAGCCAQSHY